MVVRNLVDLALSGVSDEVDSNGNLVLESPSILEWDGETRRNLFVVSVFPLSHYRVLAHLPQGNTIRLRTSPIEMEGRCRQCSIR